MKKLVLAALAALTVAPMASAANYAVFLHGRAEGTWSGPMTVPSGYIAVDAVKSWNGQARIDGSQVDYNALANLCRNGNQCVVYSYSTGGLIAARMQLVTGVNPLRQNSFASAVGGSELADACGWVTQWGCYYGGVDDNLKPSWARNGSNALQYSRGMGTKHVAGNGFAWNLGGATHPVISGDDDGAVGPHSSEGCSSTDTDGKLNGCRKEWCASRNWIGWCTDNRVEFRRKSGHSTMATGGWTHFNILPTQSSYWY